jgi:hypothetical protein
MKAVPCNYAQWQRQALCFQVGCDSTVFLSTLVSSDPVRVESIVDYGSSPGREPQGLDREKFPYL